MADKRDTPSGGRGGRNRDSGHRVKSQAKSDQNNKDEAVSRDPDVGGVNRKKSRG